MLIEAKFCVLKTLHSLIGNTQYFLHIHQGVFILGSSNKLRVFGRLAKAFAVVIRYCCRDGGANPFPNTKIYVRIV